jgi:hypothetical protein
MSTSFTVLYTKNDTKKRKAFADGICKCEKSKGAKIEYMVSLQELGSGGFVTKKIISAPLIAGEEIILNGFIVQVESEMTTVEVETSKITDKQQQPQSFSKIGNIKKFKGGSSSSYLHDSGAEDSAARQSSSSSSLTASSSQFLHGRLLKVPSTSSSSASASASAPVSSSLSSSKYQSSSTPLSISNFSISASNNEGNVGGGASTIPILDSLLKKVMNPHQIEAAEWILHKFEDNQSIEIFPENE